MHHDHARTLLGGTVSPPLVKRRRLDSPQNSVNAQSQPSPAAIEAGKAQIDDHLTYFLALYAKCRRAPSLPAQPTISLDDLTRLYTQHAGANSGHSFVIHQHDHPKAGLHYDLRLQINPTSSCSWSIPYGLPGNPWERRHGRRQAIETRIHCLWNHLIEAGSLLTGSMLIWDIGTYTVLPFEQEREEVCTDDEEGGTGSDSGSDDGGSGGEAAACTDGRGGGSGAGKSEPEKLDAAFRSGKIRLQLHGAKLPPGYTITLRLSRDKGPAARPAPIPRQSSRTIGQSKISSAIQAQVLNEEDTHSDPEANLSSQIRFENAYTGSSNTIDSVHQRWWFLAIDKANCGFVRGKSASGKVTWTAGDEETRRNYPFLVMGRDVETSVVTGRKAAEVLEDEGVVGFVPRGGWKAAV